MVEENPYRLSFLAHRNDVRSILGDIMTKCDINDISIEAEDIGIVVERIYKSGNGTNGNGNAGASAREATQAIRPTRGIRDE
jgi:hypothetical protein